MTARRRTAYWFGMLLMAMCALAQEPQTGTVPQGTPARPTSPNQGPVTSTSTQGPGGTIEMKSSPQSKEENKLTPETGGLTFLPELKPTDGVVNLAAQVSGGAQVASESAAMHEKPMLMDRAVAVINGQVILASDVREQQRFAVFQPLTAPGGAFTPMEAMQQIVNRTLLLDQMAEQEMLPPPTVSEVEQQLAELRKHIPVCGQSCETNEGWQRFLKEQGLTEAELRRYWKQRMAILDFIRVRFQTGIRITKPEIESYYKKKLLPLFETRKLTPPPLATVSDRIDEVLLQEHVNVLLEDYLRSLKDTGSVLILDPQYNSLGSPSPSGGSPAVGDVAQPSRSGGEQ
jgi:peptidyl-prolyl cis-trans isomerase SurA